MVKKTRSEDIICANLSTTRITTTIVLLLVRTCYSLISSHLECVTWALTKPISCSYRRDRTVKVLDTELLRLGQASCQKRLHCKTYLNARCQSKLDSFEVFGHATVATIIGVRLVILLVVGYIVLEHHHGRLSALSGLKHRGATLKVRPSSRASATKNFPRKDSFGVQGSGGFKELTPNWF